MAYIFDLSDAWAASGTTFTAIKMSVTDTASAAGSLLMDLQVGGASRFVVSKAGRVTLGSSANLGELQFTEGIGVKVRLGSGSGQDTFAILANNGIAFKSSGVLFWSGAEDSFGSTDLQLRRDAANTLAQRNGVNAQAFNLYNTYTDASNYERGFMRWSSNTLRIGTEAAGTGTLRDVIVGNLNNAGNVLGGRVYFGGAYLYEQYGYVNFLSTGNGFNFNSTVQTQRIDTAQFMQFTEMTAPAAPATNNVRIYAEDNGSGKTRLMAVFATGAAVQIAIEP